MESLYLIQVQAFRYDRSIDYRWASDLSWLLTGITMEDDRLIRLYSITTRALTDDTKNKMLPIYIYAQEWYQP